MMIDAERLRGFLDCMHDEADERDKKSKAISEIVKAAKEAGYDTKALRKVFVRERMDEAERAKQDNLLESYEAALGAKGRALADVRAGVPVGEAAERHGVHRATLARARHVANEPSNATDHDPETGEVREPGTGAATVVATGTLDAQPPQACSPEVEPTTSPTEDEALAAMDAARKSYEAALRARPQAGVR